jgi:deazaflavin-dependent oxidoreductase (nitroreductase family)
MSVFDNPVDARQGDGDWVGEHLRRYTETDGADGHTMWGVPTLLLTTIGRKTGTPRRTPLAFGRDGEAIIVVASLAGADHHPAWYLNLQADPRARLQVKEEIFDATAHTAPPAERPRLWKLDTG